MTLGILRRYLPGVEDAWQYTTDAVGQFFERALASHVEPQSTSLNIGTLFDVVNDDLPQLASDTIDTYLELAHKLGGLTAELHFALSSETDDPAFAPEPYTVLYQRSIYQSMRVQTIRALNELKQQICDFPVELQSDVRSLLEHEDEIMDRYRRLLSGRINATRIRCHGDYHFEERALHGAGLFDRRF